MYDSSDRCFKINKGLFLNMQFGEREVSQPLYIVLLLACVCSGINSGFWREPCAFSLFKIRYHIQEEGKGRQGNGGRQVFNVKF